MEFGLWAFLAVASLSLALFLVTLMVIVYIEKRDKAKHLAESDRQGMESLTAKLEQIESRLRNLENIVVERDKHGQFEALTGND